MSFLERVDELSEARGVDKRELFKSAIDLFSGAGLVWFRSIRKRIDNWDSLVFLLKEDFIPGNSDDLVWKQIRERKQKVSEKAPIYVAIMENLFSRLSILPAEEERVRHIRHNLLPINAQALSLNKIKTIPQLISLCRQLEDTRLYSNVPTISVAKVSEQNNDVINATLNKLIDRISKLESKLDKSNESNACIATISNSSSKESKTCWNCHKPGHHYSVCRAPRKRIFCYGCGEDGVSKNKCKNCLKNASQGRQ